MDFNLTKEQKMFEKSVEEFAAKEIAPGVDEREYESGFRRDVWNKMSQVDLTGLCLPEQYGGAGADALTTVIAAIAFARGAFDGSMCTVWGSHLFLAAMSICDLGSEEQRERYLPKMATGEWIGALALTEPDAGTDATSLGTTAVKGRRLLCLERQQNVHFQRPHRRRLCHIRDGGHIQTGGRNHRLHSRPGHPRPDLRPPHAKALRQIHANRRNVF